MATKRSERSTAPRTKVRKREQEVLDAAAQIFYERGYADATVQDVADALNILKGSLYYYIEVKEDLLYRLLVQVHDDVDEVLRKLIDEGGESGSALERLAAYVRAQTAYNLRNLVKITVYYNDVSQLSPDRRKVILSRRHSHEEYVQDLIRQSQVEGTTNPAVDAGLLANFVFSAVIWTYRWYRKRVGTVDEVADAAVAFVLGGVGISSESPAVTS